MLPGYLSRRRTIRRAVFGCVVLMLSVLAATLPAASPAHSKGNPPAEVQRALQDLSNRVGRTLELRNLSRWEWTQQAFPDASLGCPQPGQSYAQVITNGFEIIFEYNGITYDYRAAIGGDVFLCSGPEAPSATPTPAQTTTTPAAGSNGAGGRAVCEGAMDTRLASGVQARVRPSGPAVRLRADASTTSTLVQTLASGTTFAVVGGPVCGENLVWWQVEVNGGRGWVAEGSDGVYWLEPLADQPVATRTPAPTSPPPVVQNTTPTVTPGAQLFIDPGGSDEITPTNASQLAPLAELTLGERATGIAWSPDGATLAVSTPSGLWVYNATILTAPPRLLRVAGGPVLDLAISPDNLIATALTDGTVRLWDIATGGQRAVLRGHTQPVRAVAFSPDGARLASGGGDEATGADSDIRLWDTAARTQSAVLAGHEGAITDLTFSPDGTLLASASLDTTVRLWEVATASPATILTNHTAAVRAVAFSPQGTQLASGGDDAQIQVLTLGSGDQLTLEGHEAAVGALRFSPDGALLVSIGFGEDDPSLRLWDVATGEQATVKTEFSANTTQIIDLAFSPDGDSLAFITVEIGTTVRIWGAASA